MSDKILFPSYRRGDKLTKYWVQPRPFQFKKVCVKNLETGKVERVFKNIAQTRVNSGLWKFVPKSEFKGK